MHWSSTSTQVEGASLTALERIRLKNEDMSTKLRYPVESKRGVAVSYGCLKVERGHNGSLFLAVICKSLKKGGTEKCGKKEVIDNV